MRRFMTVVFSCLTILLPSACGSKPSLSGSTAKAAITTSPAAIGFGDVTVGTSAAQTERIAASGNATVTISAAAAAGTGFSASGVATPLVLAPGQSATIVISFDPTQPGAASGALSIASNAPTVMVPLSGTGVAPPPVLQSLTCVSSTLAAGPQSDSCTVSLNESAPSPVAVALSSNNAAITVPSSVTIATGATSTTFTATAAQTSTAATVVLQASAGGVAESFSIQLTAAQALLSVQSSSVAFGSVTVGQTATQTVTVTATGNLPVTITGIAVSGTAYSASGVSAGTVLTPGSGATLALQFTPGAPGELNGTTTIESTAGMYAIALTGIGEPENYAVDLTWEPVPSVAGYNVYRAPGNAGPGGAFTKVNSSPVAKLGYADTTVVSGQTYTYRVSSVDASGNESTTFPPSDYFTVTIP